MNTIKVFCPEKKSTIEFVLQGMLEAPFVDYMGNTWTQSEINSYNSYTKDINRCTYLPERELWMDRRHQYYVYTIAEKVKEKTVNL